MIQHAIQRNMLQFIDEYQRRHERAPTYREIGGAVHQGSTSVIRYHLLKLADRGYIQLDNRTSRSVQLAPAARNELGGAYLVLPFPVSLNAAYAGAGRGLRLTDKAKAYKAEVYQLANAAYRDPISYNPKPMLEGDLAMRIWLYRPERRGDIDNFTKLLQDSLQGVIYKNDNAIVEQHLYKRLDSLTPRVEVEIWRVA